MRTIKCNPCADRLVPALKYGPEPWESDGSGGAADPPTLAEATMAHV